MLSSRYTALTQTLEQPNGLVETAEAILYRALPTVLLNGTQAEQESIVATMPTGYGSDPMPPGTFPFLGAPVSVDVVDVSGNTTYSGLNKQSRPLIIPLTHERP